MQLTEKKIDLFQVENRYYLAHCISSDAKMGAGIAVEFQKRYKLRRKILSNGYAHRKHPNCILVGNIFNLTTKEMYYHKPTYSSLRGSLEKMKDIVIEEDIKYLAMPKIGSGLDRLEWVNVKKILEEVFKDLDIEILVCSLL